VTNETSDVFISYSREDWRHAADIDTALCARGLKSFFDRRSLAPGLPWVSALEQAISTAKAAIVLIGPHGFGNTQQYERALAICRQSRDPTFPVVPVILPETSTDRPFDFLQVLTWIDFSHVTKVSDAPVELEHLLAAIRGETTSAGAVRDAVCPYRGLDAFREEDSAFFFGRGKADDPNSAIGELVTKVQERPFVMVVGRSGSGKSSLINAGLLPALRHDRKQFWNVLSLRPGPAPLRALAAAFNPRTRDEGAAEYATKISNEADELKTGDPELLSHMIRQELNRAEGKPDRLLLYIDQWEELYAQAPPSSEQERASQHAADVSRFIDLLLTASRTAPVAVVGTMRADFYDPLIGHLEMRTLLPTCQVLLASMSRSELECTIVGPAKKVGLSFDPPDLVQRILDEAGEDEGMLPLLQYALKESWVLRKGNSITGDSYARSGGVREAIRVTAEGTFESLSAEDQQAARQLFLRLVTPGEGQEDTRARAAMPTEPTQRKIVQQFAGQRTRLLVTGSDRAARPTVEVAHEALIRTWPRLRQWIDTNREKLRARAAVLQAQTDWDHHAQRDDMLLPAGFQLERARELLADPGDITIDDIQDYITKSFTRDQARLEREKAAELEDARKAADAARVKADLEQRRADAEREARELSEASRKKLMRYLVFAVMALAIAIGSAGWAILESKQANNQRLLADQRLTLARTTAETLIALIPNDLRRVQSIQIRTLRQLLEHAKQSYDNLKDALWSDPTFRVSYANMSSEFGKTYLRVGDLEKAIESYDESRRDRLSAFHPGDVGSASSIADQIEEIARVRQLQGNLQGALDQYDEALAFRKQIVENDPANPKSYRDLGLSLSRRGEVLLQIGRDPAEVLKIQTLAREMTLHARDLGDRADEVDLNLSLIYGSLADVYITTSDRAEALNSLRASLALLERLVGEHPENPEFKRYLGWAHQALGTYYGDEGNWEQALPYYQDCLSVRNELLKYDDGDWIYQYDLAWAHHMIGNVLLFSTKRDLKSAFEQYSQAYKIRERLTEIDPTNQRWKKDFALSLETLGDLATKRNDGEDALLKYMKAAEHFKTLTQLDPSNSAWLRQLSRIETKISNAKRTAAGPPSTGERDGEAWR
jgi:tetratricopeptide (TPR) repeat protein/energy-coupling factor transporter ATP-binding protein EcfA2